MDKPSSRSRLLIPAAAVLAIVSMACTSAPPGPAASGPPDPASPTAPGSTVVPTTPSTPAPVVTASPPVNTASPPAPTVVPSPTLAPSPSAPEGATTYRLVLDDGPRAGTWEVSQVNIAACTYIADRDAWITTYLGPPPLTFIDASTGNDRDPLFLYSFDRDLPTATSFRPLGEVTFEADDRGEAATLTWVSDENEADFDDGSPSVETGRAELTVECAGIFRSE